MRFVDNDREFATAMRIANAVQHVRKGLHGRDDQFLAILKVFGQLLSFGAACAFFDRANNAANLGEAFDGFADLLVQYPAVRYDDHGIKDRFAILAQAD